MQNTLLGLAIACILALLAALIGPYFVNWNDHRAFFETEASRLVGLKVRVGGAIDVGVLPFPSVTLRDIEIGPEGQASRLRAGSLAIELGLGPLMRGEIRAAEMKLVAPEFSVGLNSLGQVDWPAMQLATETLSIERLKIDEGRILLTDALSGTQRVLHKLWFNGEVRSLIGPFRGKGAFTTGGQIYGYNVSAGRYSDDGLRIKLSIDDSDGPLNLEAEGVLAFERGSPRFEGNVALARPAGAVPTTGKAIISEPWRLTSKVKASFESAVLEQVAFQYGPEERAARLGGDAKLHFGEQPRLEGALSARQIDIDRLIATPDAPRRLPLAAMQAFAETFGAALRPGLPVKLAISVDALSIGGATLQAIGCDLRSDGQAWGLDKLEFRAPGFTQVRLSGRLDPSAKGLGFTGETSIDANDPKSLVAWLAGQTGSGPQIKPWQLRGVVSLGADRIAVERLKTDFERGTIEGRLAYVWSAGERPARLDAELRAGELDVDALLGFAESALSGAGLERPREVSLALEITKAKIAGFEARNTSARLKFDASGIAIERLSVADFGNATIEARGRIETTSSPGGNITIDLDARDLGGIIALADRFASPLAEPLRHLTARRKTAKLRATVSLENPAADRATGKLVLTGAIGAVRINLSADASGKSDAFVVTDLRALAATEMRLNGRLEADDGGVLLALVGLDRIVSDNRPGRLNVSANGPLDGELRFDGKLATGPISADAKGTFRRHGDRPAELRLEQIAGTIGGSAVQGRLVLAFAESPRVEGAIEVDTVNAPAVVAAAIGMPTSRAKAGEIAAWSPEPFAASTSGLAGRIEFKAKQATFSPGLTASQLQGVMRIGPSEVVFDQVMGELAKGRLDGRLAFAMGADGLSARARVAFSGADAAAIVVAEGRSPITGRVAFEAEVEGAGRSPAAFIGSLSGNGKVTLDGVQLAGLNPHVFDALLRAVDLGIPTDTNRIRDFVTSALDTASFPATRVEAPIAISAGHARVGNVGMQVGASDLAVNANVNLADAAFDAVLTLRGAPFAAGGVRPMVLITLRGPLAAPRRAVDANALPNWLAMRAIDQQSKRLDAMDQLRREAIAQPPVDVREPVAAQESVPSASPPPAAAAPAPVSGPASETTNSIPAANQPPPLPPAIIVVPAPRPRPAPRADATVPPAQTRPAAVPRNPPPPRPLDLIGAQH